MPEAADFELEREPPVGGPPVSRPPSLLPWILAAAVIGAGAAAYYYYSSRDGDTPATAGVTATDAPVAAAEPLGVDVPPIELPPLDATDMLVRDLVRGLSSHPGIAAWLATDGLIRNFTVVVENIAAGRTPSRHLRVLKPQGAFAVLDGGGAPVVDPRSYARYNNIAEAVASVDPDGAAKLYSTLKPRIEEAYAEIGSGPFDRALETAIVRLLEVPAADGEIALTPKGALYHYNDVRLERLTQAQKQLLRMGARNVRTIQRTLRNVALALGVPVSRLPPR
jgi:hypothetical protein